MLQRNAIAMLNCQDSEKDGDNCTHCQTASGDNRLYWGIQLDQDLLETIVGIYPEWFKDCNMNLAAPRVDAVEEAEKSKPTIIPLTPDSKHNKMDDEPSLFQKSIERNKESLKLKLMLRRPINQLIDQGILPPLKSPSAFHEQRQKLERAKMGDILKNKIQKRPDRQVLIQQNILVDTTIDASLQEKQRALKKSKFIDSLNNQISSRPGPLELIKNNMMQADEALAQAVREGTLQFRCTSEDSPPLLKILNDDSESEFGSPSPPYNFSEHSHGSFPSLEASEPSPIPMNSGSPCSARTSFSMSPPSSVSSPLSLIQSVVSPQPEPTPEFIINGLLLQSKETPVKTRKKSKPKTQPKARTIKFHEYKGPPSAQKNVPSPASTNGTTETSYDLLLQQQQLFLQWQLEWQQKYPQSVMAQTSQTTNGDQSTQPNQTTNSASSVVQNSDSPLSPQKIITKLEDLKVSDLKAELKKRNLPVSGPKPILIERLKCYAESSHNKVNNSSSPSSNTNDTFSVNKVPLPSNTATAVNIGGIIVDNLSSIPATSGDVDISSFDLNVVQDNNLQSDIYDNLDNQDPETLPVQQNTTINLDVCSDISEVNDSSILTNEAIVEFQQRCIEKLQMELQKSQLQLHHNIICHQPLPSEDATLDDDIAVIPTPQPAVQVPSTSVKSSLSSSPTTSTISTSSSTRSVPTVVTVQSQEVKEKLRQRQLIHQQLQQKIHQQSLMLQQQNQLKEAQNGKAKENTPNTSNSPLTALLKSEPIQSPVEINLTSVQDLDEDSVKSIACYPANAQQKDEVAYPGVVSLFMDSNQTSGNTSNTAATRKSSVVSTGHNANTTAHRTSSLPSFSALVSNKAPPSRSNTDPLFMIDRPPPNYNEATRQLNKIKQQMFQNTEYDTDLRHPKKLKSSVKCQAVDDVLEILIKNGELPPSAAHEPQTPTTLCAKRKMSSPPSYQSPSLTSPAITMSTNSISSPIVTVVTPVNHSTPEGESGANLHMSSLQSVLDMTPPSSAGFGEPNHSTPTSLDFDFHLDVEDIEVMNLEGLSQDDPQSIQTLPTNIPKPSSNPRHHHLENHIIPPMNGTHELIDYQSRNMDADIIEWLELLGENTVATINTSTPCYQNTNYSIQNEHDPMLSNAGNCQDSLDLFSVDDMDFKTNEASILSWDKADFAT